MRPSSVGRFLHTRRDDVARYRDDMIVITNARGGAAHFAWPTRGRRRRTNTRQPVITIIVYYSDDDDDPTTAFPDGSGRTSCDGNRRRFVGAGVFDTARRTGGKRHRVLTINSDLLRKSKHSPTVESGRHPNVIGSVVFDF